jgi:peptidoglycan hydrolase-like amidase
MSVGGVVFKGTAVRSILGLKSTNVIFRELDDGRILTVTFGYGHGVGMSQ